MHRNIRIIIILVDITDNIFEEFVQILEHLLT